MQELSSPLSKPDYVLHRRYCVFVTVGGVHSPPEILSRGQRQERRPAIPVSGTECPGDSDQIQGEARIDEGPDCQRRHQRGPTRPRRGGRMTNFWIQVISLIGAVL